jgi:hypothetical protein
MCPFKSHGEKHDEFHLKHENQQSAIDSTASPVDNYRVPGNELKANVAFSLQLILRCTRYE